MIIVQNWNNKSDCRSSSSSYTKSFFIWSWSFYFYARRVNIKVWLGFVSSCSSCPFIGLCSQMEWHVGWIWWAVLVSLTILIVLSYSLFLSIPFSFICLVLVTTCTFFSWLSEFHLIFWLFHPLFYRYVALLVVSLVCYVLTFGFSGLLFHWFTPSGQDCGLNTFFIVMTLILAFIFAVVALHPAVSSHFPSYQRLLSLIYSHCFIHMNVLFSMNKMW